MAVKIRHIRFLDKGTGIVNQAELPYPDQWTAGEVAEDIERDVPFVQVLEVSSQPIAGLYGKIVDADPKFAPEGVLRGEQS